MPTIPTFESDASVRTPGMSLGTPKPTIDASGIMRASQQATNAYNREQERQRLEQEQLAQNEAKLQVINAGSDLEIRSRTQLQSDIDAGNIAGSTDRLLKSYDQWTEEAVAGASPKAQPAMRLHLATQRAGVNLLAYQAETQGRREAITTGFAGGTATDEKLVYADPSQFPDRLAQRMALASSLALPPKERDALIQRATTGMAFQAAAGIVDRDPAAFLARAGMTGTTHPEAAQMALDSDPILSSLRPEDYRNLVDHATANVAAKNAAAARAGDQVLLDAEKATKELDTFVNDGSMPTLDYANQVLDRTRGTPYEERATQLLSAARAGAGFGSQTLPRQAAALQQGEAILAKGSSPDDQAQLQRLRQIHETQVVAYRENPWDAGARFARLPPQPEMKVTAPEGGVALIQQRLPLIGGVETASGGPVSPLQPGEAASWAETLKTLPVDRRAEALAAAGQGLSGGQIAALAAQIDKSDRPTALMLVLNDRTNAGRAVAARVGLGAQAITDKTVKADDTKLAGWKAEAAGYLRGAIGDKTAEDQAIDAAYYVRASFDSPGATPPGFDASTNTVENAVRMVVGQPIERGGLKTILPRGMDERDFDNRLRTYSDPASLKALAPSGKVYAGGREIPLEVFHGHITDRGMRLLKSGIYVPCVGNTPVTLDKAGTQLLTFRMQ